MGLSPVGESQQQEADDTAAATPFVAGLLEEPQLAVGAFDMIVRANHGRTNHQRANSRRCTDAGRGRRAEEGDHLLELVAIQHLHRLRQFGDRRERRVAQQLRAAAVSLVGRRGTLWVRRRTAVPL